RYASTQPAPAAPAPAPTPAGAVDPTPAAAAPSALPSDVSATPVDIDIRTLDVLNMPEQIGYLKAMGLDYGWGPTAFMETILEHTYIYTGMPWWASIVTVGVLLRAALFIPSLRAAETSYKMQELRKNPKYEAIRKLSTDFGNSDTSVLQKARTDLAAFHRAHGIKMWRTFIPMLNMPIIYGFFRLFRGMSDLPVPTLETGGALWFTDLSAADPYYIMPIASSVTMFFVMRSSLAYMPPDQAKIMKFISIVMAPLTLWFTINFSAGLQLFLLTTGLLQSCQSILFLQPWFRNFAGLPPLVRLAPLSGKPAAPLSASAAQWHAPRTMSTTATTVAEEPSPKKAGMFADMKESARDARSSLTKTLKNYSAKGDVKADKRKAQEYEERRALEEKERYYARLEEQRLKALEKQRKGQ
ncbi:60Kd inner membrane protein-domain-containing protein, partial [Coniochaeta sp. 2T2.1]